MLRPFFIIVLIKPPKISIKMKTFLISLAILTAGAIGFVIGHFAFNGSNPAAGYIAAPGPADKINTLNFAPRDSSRAWVKNYKTIWQTIVPEDLKLADSLPQSFTIKSQDVLNAMGIDTSWKYVTKLRYIRLTLGYDAVNKSMKAFIQPVVNVNLKEKPFTAGTALFFDIGGKIVDSAGHRIDSLDTPYFAPGMKAGKIRRKPGTRDGGGVYVGDLSTPCPNTCGN
jgi:hypothetical protein